MKPLAWVGSPKADLLSFPADVVREIGHALYLAQIGDKHPTAKPLKGFGGAGVLEVVERDDSDTFRAVYTVRFHEAVYVLHAFQKKSRQGIATPDHEIAMIRERLKREREAHAEWQEKKP